MKIIFKIYNLKFNIYFKFKLNYITGYNLNRKIETQLISDLFKRERKNA